MVRRLLQVVLCLGALTIVLTCAKTKTAKGVMVVENGQTRIVTMSLQEGPGNVTELPLLWDPGMVVLFRTTETVKPLPALKVPEGETGKAGEAYVVTDDYKLRKIGEFDLKKSDQELAPRFMEYK